MHDLDTVFYLYNNILLVFFCGLLFFSCDIQAYEKLRGAPSMNKVVITEVIIRASVLFHQKLTNKHLSNALVSLFLVLFVHVLPCASENNENNGVSSITSPPLIHWTIGTETCQDNGINH